MWLLVSSLARVGDVLGVDTPPALLPPLGELLKHLTVAGAVSWVDDKGWHFRAVTPFHGSTMIASETAGRMDVQTSALGLSIMLPALGRARDQANTIKSASNLRMIGQSVMIYANENKDSPTTSAGPRDGESRSRFSNTGHDSGATRPGRRRGQALAQRQAITFKRQGRVRPAPTGVGLRGPGREEGITPFCDGQ